MAEEETQRGTPKRQIARLIGNASMPIYVLGSDDRLLFANDALSRLLGVDSESLVGIDCSRNIPIDDSETAILGASLALPPNFDRSLMDLHSIDLPRVSSSWVRVVFPLEDSQYPMVLCAMKKEQGDLDSLRIASHRAELQRFLARSSFQSKPGEDLWFLSGKSPSILRTRHQMESVRHSTSQSSVRVIGPAASSILAVAQWIAAKRTLQSSTPFLPAGPITVECEWMDRELLLSTLEMIDEHSRVHSKSPGTPSIIFHQIDRLPGSLVESLCSWHASAKRPVIATSAARDLISMHSRHAAWGEFAAGLDAHVIDVPSLAERITDIEALVAVWLETTLRREEGELKYRWTREFIDAMLAYPWPGDVQEFDEMMREATRRCTGHLLTDQELPISIRTFPSHLRRSAPLAKLDLDSVLEQLERQLLQQAISHFPRNRTAAADHLGISRARFLRRIQQLGLETVDPAKCSESDEPMFEEWDGDSPEQPIEPSSQ